MELNTAKGTKDTNPEEKIAKDKIITTIKQVIEKYGYLPLDTPAIEKWDVLTAKYAGGSEILKETFKLKDQGNRDLGLRYDLTVPLSRFIGTNPQIKLPFKRYQIDKVWRDGPIGMARYREFLQCDADIVGCKNVLAEAELLALAQEVFQKLELNTIIKVNNIKLLKSLVKTITNTENIEEVIICIDKLAKIGKEEVKIELEKKNVKNTEKLLKTLEENSLEKLKIIIKDEEGIQGIKELQELFNYLKYFKVKNVVLQTSLARGLTYYTGTILEMYLKKSEIKTAIGSGGRYDKMIGNFLNSKIEFPATGVSFGIERIYEALKLENKIPIQKTTTKVYIIPINTLKQSINLLQELRKNNIKTDIDLLNRGVSKNLNYANEYKIPFVIFIGDDEIKAKKYKLRDMNTGKELNLNEKELIKKL